MSAFNSIRGLWETQTGRMVMTAGAFVFGGAAIYFFRTGGDQPQSAQPIRTPGSLLAYPEVSRGEFNVQVATPAGNPKGNPPPPPLINPEKQKGRTIKAARGQQTRRLPEAPLRIFSSRKAPKPTSLFDYEPSEESAPFGRLLKCELFNTIDSNSVEAPIIGLVVEDLIWDGNLIVPANSEIHGSARGTSNRDRIGADSDWTIVLYEPTEKSKRELLVRGTVLDREETPSGMSYSLTDGSPGLRGKVIESQDNKEIKLFAAAFLSGFSRNFQSRTTSFSGNEQVQSSVGNAALEGSSEVLDEYADQIRQAIERDGSYVRVPAGKQFYVYLKQTMDLRAARQGATAISRAGASQNDFNGIQNDRKQAKPRR